MGHQGTTYQQPFSYAIDTAYGQNNQNRDLTKSYNERLTQSRDRTHRTQRANNETGVFGQSSQNIDSINVPLNDTLIHDYCQMLTPDNNKEMQAFGIQSLDSMIDEAIRKIMSSSDLLLKVFSIADCFGSTGFSFDIQQSQYRILQKIAENMNEGRASEIILRNSGLHRLLKNLNFHNSRFQPIITNLITRIVQSGKRSLDVKSMFALTHPQFSSGSLAGIQDIAIKGLVELSENKLEE